MVGSEIRTMLKAEMEASDKFSRRNFGLAVGDGFREMVEEIVKDDGVSGKLLCGVLFAGLGGKGFAESLKNTVPQGPGAGLALSQAILENMQTFQPMMEFLYWGIQVGRKLAMEEAKVLSKLEQDGLKA